MQSTLSAVTVVVVGIMVGVEFAVAIFVTPILDRLPDDASFAARTDGGRLLGRIMPFWYFGSTLLGALWAVLAWGDVGASLALLGTALLIVSIVMSVAVLVPINNRVVKWTQGTRPVDWKQQVQRWDRYHYARVAVIVAAFAVFAAALS